MTITMLLSTFLVLILCWVLCLIGNDAYGKLMTLFRSKEPVAVMQHLHHGGWLLLAVVAFAVTLGTHMLQFGNQVCEQTCQYTGADTGEVQTSTMMCGCKVDVGVPK